METIWPHWTVNWQQLVNVNDILFTNNLYLLWYVASQKMIEARRRRKFLKHKSTSPVSKLVRFSSFLKKKSEKWSVYFPLPGVDFHFSEVEKIRVWNLCFAWIPRLKVENKHYAPYLFFLLFWTCRIILHVHVEFILHVHVQKKGPISGFFST